MDEFARKIEAQREQHRQEMDETREILFGPTARSSRPLMPDMSNLSIDDAISAYTTWVETAVSTNQQAWLAARLPPAPTPSPETEARLRQTLAQQPAATQLAYVDNLVEELFDIRRIFPTVRHNTDVYFCRTTAEFVRPLAAIGLSAAEQNRLIAQGNQGVFDGPVLAYDAYYLPDKGCYVNGPRLANGRDPEQALDDPETFFRAVQAIAQTMWGWGFLIDYSEAGQQRKRANLWQPEVAAQLGLADLAASYPPLVTQIRQHAVLLETGWSTWIGEVVMQAARRQKLGGWERPSFSHKDFWQILRSAIGEIVSEMPGWDLFLPVKGGLRQLMGTHEDGQAYVHRQLVKRRTAVLNLETKIQQVSGRSGATWLSRLVLDKVEARVGSFCMPYAMLIAANISYDLNAPGLAALTNNPALVPQGSMDTRLWLLSYLDESVKYDVSTMAIAAWDILNLASPLALRQA